MGVYTMTKSRVGDSTVGIAVHEDAIQIEVNRLRLSSRASADIRRTAYALLSAAEEFDRQQRQRTARAGAAEDEHPR